ncbi:MAG: long-chain fatty acid--CoA ligase [Bacteroidetes bacterium]|nr:long-chain fatty acid--CoA ligase [Bacteroidota bacterium]
MEVTRLFDLLPYHKNKFQPKDDVLAGKEDGVWIKYSIDQYIEAAENISYGFLKLGVQKGDKIATISNNRPEWNFLDMGIAQTGAIHVPIYPTISEADYKYILNHAEVKYVFVAGQELLRKIEHILPEVPSLKGLYTFRHIDTVKHLKDLIDLGKANPVPEKLQEIRDSIKPDDITTLIYTSGTTGVPKGVMLTHANLLSNVEGVYRIFPLDETCIGLSYLPLCHVYERMNIYTYQYLGVSIYYAENMGTIGDNIREISPHILTTVPRLLEKVYDKILAKGRKLKGVKRNIFFWAVNLANAYELKGKSPFYRMQLAIADKLVFSKWREALGNRMRVIVSGGAALQPRLARIYTAAGIPVLEGYGLTETSPVIAVNNFDPGGQKFGTVGPPLHNVQVKIGDDGEILAKGPNVMVGYYKEPELTKEVLTPDGWFHTGDMGMIDEDGHLKITGRKKEIFKTSLGKYISPQLLENRFKESPFIDAAMVVGEHQKYAAALIVPDFVYLRSWCGVKGIPYTSDEDMITHKEIKDRIKKEIDHYNSFFGTTEKVMSHDILGKEWSVENGELTASLKLRRNFIHEKYKENIERLFAGK